MLITTTRSYPQLCNIFALALLSLKTSKFVGLTIYRCKVRIKYLYYIYLQNPSYIKNIYLTFKLVVVSLFFYIFIKPDGILNEALKTCRPLIVPWLADVARACFAIGYYLRLRRAIITFVLRKKGKADYSFPGSYRPIALENTRSKILKRVIADRMADIAKEHALLL